MRDLYNRKQRLQYWIDRINSDLYDTDKVDVVNFIQHMHDNERAILWIIRCVTALILLRKQLKCLANFENPILGIKFQYPTEWSPVTLTQNGNLNTIKYNNPYYTTKFPDTLLESRYTSDALLKIENFFPLEINLLQYMDKQFG